MNQHAEHEVPALLPACDAPAIADPATGWALRALRTPVIAMPVAGLVALAGAIALWVAGVDEVFVFMVGLAAVIGLGVAGAVGLRYTSWIGPARRLLAEQPWREAEVRVFRAAKGMGCRLRVQELGQEPVWLSVSGLNWSGQQVLARTGRVWLVGPDAEGHAAVRSSGLAVPMAQAKVTTQVPNDVAVQPEQTAPRRAPKAGDDAVVAKMLAGPRRRSRTDLVAPVLLLALALFVLVAVLRSNHSVPRYGELVLAVVAVIVLLVAFTGWRAARLLRTRKVDSMLAAGPWRSVPVVVDGRPEPGSSVLRGNATLPDGATVQVHVPRAGFVLSANVAATGLLWVAGEPAAGSRTVAGLPGYPVLAVATFAG